jgi:D-glycero-D-manno-heptose 1,7-bisphosphate phosphatase
MMPRPAFFFDRDGIINVPPPPEQRYLLRAEEFELMPGIAAAIALVNRAAWPVVVVTNQKCIALGRLDEAGLAAIHARMSDLLAREGARVDAIHYCPHDDAAACDCKKPKPGMLLRAARDLDIDLEASWLVGDQVRDCQAGRAAGCRTVLVGEETSAHADFVLASTDELAGWMKRNIFP